MSNPTLVLNSFGYEAGEWRVEKHPRFLADLTGDGRADIIGFADAGVYVSLNNGDETFKPAKLVLDKFGYEAGKWRVEKHPRFLADLTGDGFADIIGFGDAGVYVSLNNGDGTFEPAKLVLDKFGYEAGGWRVEKHPRFLADLTGDGRADIIGFADAGVYVSLNKGDGTFQAPKLAINGFGYEAGGWRVEKHPRFLADLTGDGRADIIGFADAGVYVSLNNGDGTFKPAKLVLDKFGYEAGKWRVEKHPRFLADLTGDGRADIIGFADAGVYVSLNKGDGTFKPAKLVLDKFGYEAGKWRVEKHPRFLADLTGDGRADIIGFADAGVYVSLNKGDGTFQAPELVLDNFGYEAGGWRVEKHPRFLADLKGDGSKDLVGFGDAGVYISHLSVSPSPMHSVLIITSRENLRNKYGQTSFDQIEIKIGDYIQALANTGVDAVLVYVDSADSLEEYGLSPVDPENASDIKGLVDKLDMKLSPAYTLIIGGHSIIPFHILPNPCEGDGDNEVYSDSPYASKDDEFLIPGRALARLPDDSSADASFLLSLIENITVRVKGAPRSSFGYSAKVWTGASEAVYDVIENGQDLKLSPPVVSNNLVEEWINSKGYFYFNLHGSEDTGNWYGQDDYGYPVAFAPENLSDVNVENAVVCTEACYGANIIEKKVGDALSLKFLAKKVACFVGSTKIAYGPSEPPNTDADLIVLKFFERIKEGLSFGEAFLRAKQDFAQESIKNKGYLDTTEKKTLLEYVIFADPSARMEEIE